MIDAVKKVREHLLANGTVAGLISNRLYAPTLVEGYSITDGPAVSFQRSGGEGDPWVPELAEANFAFKSWGETPEKADETFRALYDALQGKGGRGFLEAEMIVGPQDLVDPDTRWPFVFSSFRVIFKS